MNIDTRRLRVPYLSRSGEKWYLEAEARIPTSAANQLAIICHPHPLFGGNMYNNVVSALFDGIGDKIVTFRFNFSGVGESSGQYEDASGERAQVARVLEFILKNDLGSTEAENEGIIFSENDHEGLEQEGEKNDERTTVQGAKRWKRVHVIGYSFGAAVSAPVALGSPLVDSFVAIAFPFGLFEQLASESVEKSKETKITKKILLITGDRDDFTPIEMFNSWIARFPGAATKIIPGCDHFFRGFEERVARDVNNFLKTS